MKVMFPAVPDRTAAAKLDALLYRCAAAIERERLDWATPVGLVEVDAKTMLHVQSDDGREFLLPFSTSQAGVTFGRHVYKERIPIQTEFVPIAAKALASKERTTVQSESTKPTDKIQAGRKGVGVDYLHVPLEGSPEAAARDAARKAKAQADADARMPKRKKVGTFVGPHGGSIVTEAFSEIYGDPAAAKLLHVTTPDESEPEKAKATVDSDPLHLAASRKAANKGKLPSEQV